MAGDDLDLSEFEEFSSTAKEQAQRTSPEKGRAEPPDEASSGPRRLPWFLGGLFLGIALAVFGPDLAEPYLPTVLRPGGEEVRGPVVAKRVGTERVLLTVDTDRGALLATFRQRVPEIDLLVEEGDTVTLGIPAYAPLVEDPVLAAVQKGAGDGTAEGEGGLDAAEPDRASGAAAAPDPEGGASEEPGLAEDGPADGGSDEDAPNGGGGSPSGDPGP